MAKNSSLSPLARENLAQEESCRCGERGQLTLEPVILNRRKDLVKSSDNSGIAVTEKIFWTTCWFLTLATIQVTELCPQAEAIVAWSVMKTIKNQYFKIKVLDKTI
jgi:hypothetical protein